MPGLLYVLDYDIKKEEELRSDLLDRQDYADIYSRLAMTKAAEEWNAVPTGDAKAALLDVAYETDRTQIWLWTAADKVMTLPTKHPLASPFRSGPGDDLAQSLFFLPDRRVLTLMADGWELFAADGKEIQFFAWPEDAGGWWHDPVLKDGQITVYLQNGPGGTNYTLDMTAGKLVAR